MIESHRVIALIPARGGSKTVPNKNLCLLGGKPLIAWPIETALATPEIDRVLVSTDSAAIAARARAHGAEVTDRPAHLAGDDALIADAIRHLRGVLRDQGEAAEIMVLLEPTSPFRTPVLISRCLARLIDETLDSIATFHDAALNPERAWRIEHGRPRPFIDGAVPWRPRQQLSPAYQLNGALYAFRLDRLPPHGAALLFGASGAEIVAPRDVIDIDDEHDLKAANALLDARDRARTA